MERQSQRIVSAFRHHWPIFHAVAGDLSWSLEPGGYLRGTPVFSASAAHAELRERLTAIEEKLTEIQNARQI